MMTTTDLDTIIKAYSNSSESDLSHNLAPGTIIDEDSMVTRLQASMIEEESLFPEKFADPYEFAEEVVNSVLETETATINDIIENDSNEADIEMLTTYEDEAPFAAEAQETQIQDQPQENHQLEDQQLLEDIRNIPDRLAFKIGDVAEIVDVKQYILRYWETEFEALKPKKSRQNQRMYSRKDIENILLIKKLLYRDKFSIEGARRALKSLKAQVKETKQWDQVADRYENAIEQVRSFADDVKALKLLFSEEK